jgi:hypothetical protein
VAASPSMMLRTLTLTSVEGCASRPFSHAPSSSATWLKGGVVICAGPCVVYSSSFIKKNTHTHGGGDKTTAPPVASAASSSLGAVASYLCENPRSANGGVGG